MRDIQNLSGCDGYQVSISFFTCTVRNAFFERVVTAVSFGWADVATLNSANWLPITPSEEKLAEMVIFLSISGRTPTAQAKQVWVRGRLVVRRSRKTNLGASSKL